MPEDLIGQANLILDGSQAPREIMDDLMEVEVNTTLHLPSMFVLRLRNADMRWLEAPTFAIGKKAEVWAGRGRSLKKLMTGKIAALEPDLAENDPTLVVRGYDLSYALYRGRYTRSFQQVTDSDLVQRIGREAGLQVQADATAQVHDYVFQNNQSNAAFLLARAHRIGYELYVEDETLYFRRPPSGGDVAATLEWGLELKNFRPRLAATEQVDEVLVKGWDPRTKEGIVGRARRGQGAPQIGESQPGSRMAREAWGEAQVVVVDQPVASQGEAEAMAQAILDELTGAFIEAEGVANGNPEIKPGKRLELQGLGPRFNGQYYVTAATHTCNRTEGYLTTFTISGRRAGTMLELLQAQPQPTLGPGVVIGIVTNNQDPHGLGRVKVKFPWLSTEDESAWARIAAPMAGQGRGFYYLPEVNDEVLVAFEHGDIHRPYILGGLWNGRDTPPKKNREVVGGGGRVEQRIIKSRAGHTITLDDSDGHPSITIVDKTGNNRIIINSQDNSLKLQAQGNLTFEARGKVTIKGQAGVEITSSGNVDIKGATINLN